MLLTVVAAVGSIPDDPVPCAVHVDRNMALSGLRMGLPSNFGWVNPGLQGEVSALAVLP